MPTKTNLKIDWATHEAAKFACENWHYSKSVPAGKLVKTGVWESEKFIGVVIFSSGATPQIGSPYGLEQTEICELTRVALNRHKSTVSKIIAVALRFLKKHCPGIKLVVSYADIDQKHHGGIYQAGNWVYCGTTKPDCYIKVKEIIEHRKSVYERYGCQSLEWIKKNIDPKAERVPDNGKHKYLMPLDDEMRKKIQSLAKPYPKRAGSIVADATGFQSVEGGSIPTPALQNQSEVSNG